MSDIPQHDNLDQVDMLCDESAVRDKPLRLQRRRHWEVLIICSAIVLVLLFLETDSRRVSLIGLPQFPVPELCLTQSFFKIDCPGCGLTRSCLSLSHGDWRASLAYHRLGWLVLSLVVIQVPYRTFALLNPSKQLQKDVWSARIAVFAAVALFVNWCVKMLN